MADPPRWALQPRSVVVRASSVACSTVVVDDVGSLLLTSTSLSSINKRSYFVVMVDVMSHRLYRLLM